MTRTSRLTVTAVLLVALATGCGFSASLGEASVSADDVESQATEQFSQQFPVDSVDCPDDLPGEVGATVTCRLVSEGTAYEMTATVTSVEGDTVNFDLELTSELPS